MGITGMALISCASHAASAVIRAAGSVIELASVKWVSNGLSIHVL